MKEFPGENLGGVEGAGNQDNENEQAMQTPGSVRQLPMFPAKTRSNSRTHYYQGPGGNKQAKLKEG